MFLFKLILWYNFRFFFFLLPLCLDDLNVASFAGFAHVANAFAIDITLVCRRIHRLCRACLHSLDGRPRSSFPVVALITSRPWSPTAQFTLKLGAFPGCRASALLIPVKNKQKTKVFKSTFSQEVIFTIVMLFDLCPDPKSTLGTITSAYMQQMWPLTGNSHH